MFSLSAAIIVQNTQTKSKTKIKLFIWFKVQCDVKCTQHEETILFQKESDMRTQLRGISNNLTLSCKVKASK